MADPHIRALAIETTSRRGEVALVEQGAVIAEAAFEAGLKHTAHLVPLVDGLMREAGWAPYEAREVYVSVGPGGFTGTRVGVTFAKSFAFAAGAKVVAVPTPRVVVEDAPPEARHALVVVDARRGKVWAEPFARSGHEWKPAGEPRLTTLSEALAEAPRPIWLLGEGVAYHAGAIDPSDRQVHTAPEAAPRARHVATLGWRMARQGRFTDPFALTPRYVRRPEAEEKRLGIA